MRILVVEDEHVIAEGIKKGLVQEGYAVDIALDGNAGYDLATTEEYDTLLIDWMLPGMDGLTLVKQLRKENCKAPILMLTAKNQLKDKVVGLDSGVDDYLSKPFAFAELLARIRALLRRPKTPLPLQLEAGNVMVDTITKQVKVNSKTLKVSAKEFALLEYLMRHAGQTVSKEQIIAHVWDYDADVLPNTVEVYVKKLRGKEIQIQTIRGFGYRLE